MSDKNNVQLGSILKSNDKLFTGKKKSRNVVVTQYTTTKKGVSRILSLAEKDSKNGTTLVPIDYTKYSSLTEPSGVDYQIYNKVKSKNSGKADINFGSMHNTGEVLDSEDLSKVLGHVKKRGGKSHFSHNAKYSRRK